MNTALQRIQNAAPVGKLTDLPVEADDDDLIPPADPILDGDLADLVDETKDDAAASSATASAGALQGPLQGDESKGGAMSSPGVRGAPVKKPVKPAAKKPAAPAAKPKTPTPVEKAMYIAPKPPALWQRRKVGVVVTKGADGKRLMILVTSNSYRDREREAIATKALKGYVEKAWSIAEGRCEPQNEFRFWHSGVIGDVVYADMEGPFLIEVAKERTNRIVNLARPRRRPFLISIKEVWDYLEANPDQIDWGASHGYKHYPSQRSADGVYKQIYKFESSVLPLRWAANPYTFSGVVDVEPRDNLLQKLVGRANAKAVRHGVRGLKRELDKQGVQHKEKKPAEAVVAEKGLLEDLQEKIQGMVGEITDDPELVKKFSGEVLEAITAMAGADHPEPDGDEDAAGNEPLATEEEADDGYQYDDSEAELEPSGMSRKGLKLLDDLIVTQGDLVEDIQALVEGQKALLPVTVSLNKRLSAMEKQLKMAPQAASESPDTEVDDEDLLARVKSVMDKYDPFWGAHTGAE